MIENWRKSSYSGSTANSECVEVGTTPAKDMVGIRDTKSRELGHLDVSRRTWTTFVRHVTR